jgi:hypothetical protein
VNLTVPTISGTLQQGQSLTASPGTWLDTPASYTYQWQDCSSGSCSDIPQATVSSYTLRGSDVGHAIDVVVTATNAAGFSSVTSAQTTAVNSPTVAEPSISAVTTSNVTGTSATFTATINPNGIATTVAFEYGPTLSYGSGTPNQSVGSGTTPQTVTATVTGLTPGVTYHVRAAAVQ